MRISWQKTALLGSAAALGAWWWRRRPRIAVIELSGIIGGSVRTGEYVRRFEALRTDRAVRSVVVDIDSPGGSASASYYLYAALARVAAAKPVVAFIRGSGTSGAYLLSCAATKVVALPGAVVGSIGVISVRPVLQELLQRLGVKVTVTKSGPLKDMGAPYREPTTEEQEKEQALVNEFYEDFLRVVGEARGLERETVLRYATGEVFTARRAVEMGLVDELGDLDRALDRAAELSGIPKRPVYLRPHRTWRDLLFSRLAAAFWESGMEALEGRLERRVWL